ncbi:hypothetical protein DK880_00793 [Candidatus Cardinium hertigii]|uniref:Uncharacterized protein n=1 Tax=Candidatus Cardinium hertigii TaxID=247481 RepID=A0A2Z3L9R1_9BACT|nr:hypothetical protein DK880_00793 [Candidatus Cardinium hertigii]
MIVFLCRPLYRNIPTITMVTYKPIAYVTVVACPHPQSLFGTNWFLLFLSIFSYLQSKGVVFIKTDQKSFMF